MRGDFLDAEWGVGADRILGKHEGSECFTH